MLSPDTHKHANHSLAGKRPLPTPLLVANPLLIARAIVSAKLRPPLAACRAMLSPDTDTHSDHALAGRLGTSLPLPTPLLVASSLLITRAIVSAKLRPPLATCRAMLSPDTDTHSDHALAGNLAISLPLPTPLLFSSFLLIARAFVSAKLRPPLAACRAMLSPDTDRHSNHSLAGNLGTSLPRVRVCVVHLSTPPPLPPSNNKQQRNAPQRRHTECRAGQNRPEAHPYRKQG